LPHLRPRIALDVQPSQLTTNRKKKHFTELLNTLDKEKNYDSEVENQVEELP